MAAVTICSDFGAQKNKVALQMETQLEIEEKNDMGRPSFGEQGP